MTVDGFAYHYHPHHHPHHHHPHQSPGHQQESSLFLPFSIFHFPFSFFLYFFSFRRARPTKPCPVSCDCNCDDGHILLFLHLPSRCPGQRQNKKASRAEKKKVKFSSNFPFVIHHILYTRVGIVNGEKRKILRAR